MKVTLLYLALFFIALTGGLFYLNKTSFFAPESKEIKSPTLKKVKVGYMPFTSNWVMFLALEKGFFMDEGLEVEPISFTSGTDALNALAQGNIAVHAINTYTDLFNLEARTPGSFKLLIIQQTSNQASNEALIVSQDSSIKEVKQLTGKKIGITPGVFTEAMIKKAFENEIDFTKNTQIIKLPPQAQLAALENGDIDALLAYEPAITIGQEKGTTTILEDHPWRRVQEPFPVGGYTISTKFANENPEVTEKVTKALIRSLEYGAQYPDQIVAATAKFTNLNEELVKKLRQNENIMTKDLSPDYFDETAKLYFDLGQVEVIIDNANLKYDN